jgi:hypothetical protein
MGPFELPYPEDKVLKDCALEKSSSPQGALSIFTFFTVAENGSDAVNASTSESGKASPLNPLPDEGKGSSKASSGTLENGSLIPFPPVSRNGSFPKFAGGD